MPSTFPHRRSVLLQRALAGAFVVFAALAPPGLAADSERTAAETARIAEAMRILPNQLNQFEANPGGKTTVRGDLGAKALSLVIPDLPAAEKLEFAMGQAMFEKLWVSSPSSTKASDGLGPRYNARNCAACHPGHGRALGPAGDGPLPVGLVLRLSVPGGPEMAEIEGYLATHKDPSFGGQLQPENIAGLRAEGTPTVRYTMRSVTLGDGSGVTLRAPIYDTGAKLSPDTMISPRLGPSLLGMGLIDAIRAQDILAQSDPYDANNDGISGRANIVLSQETGKPMLGRYGWKAETPTLREQVADAFAHDIGISTTVFPDPWGDCTPLQTACRSAPHGDQDVRGTELDDIGLHLTTHFVASLAVPARTAKPETVLRGRDLFLSTGCATCHTPAYVTQRRENDPRGFQMIWPYSDFLLHDMGPDLADNRPASRATGSEWRTPPLWG
ncbi:MAG: di-heme oxidoredictase family protein, partial [Thalassovita sp.]